MIPFFLVVVLASCFAQEPEPTTRAAEIEWLRRNKAKMLVQDTPSRTEQAIARVTGNTAVERLLGSFPGFRLRTGGLITGSGFGVGPEYYRPDLANGSVALRVGGSGSTRRFYKYDALLAFRRLASNQFTAELYAAHADYPSIPYFGPGQDSARTGRTNFRREETMADARAGWRPNRAVLVGITGGHVWYNAGPGKDKRFASADRVYSPVQSPGIQEQTSFLRGGTFAELDLRDSPTDPHEGSRLRASYIYHHDHRLRTYSFKRLDASAESYIPFFNNKRVIAIRAKTEMSFRGPNQLVPFYLQPSLGGPDDLRGYRQYRFYDNNLMAANLEYRWEAFPALDMALFLDGGKVFRRVREFDLRRWATSAGGGFRFKTRTGVAFRFDVGFSREGIRVWFKFSDVFAQPAWLRP